MLFCLTLLDILSHRLCNSSKTEKLILIKALFILLNVYKYKLSQAGSHAVCELDNILTRDRLLLQSRSHTKDNHEFHPLAARSHTVKGLRHEVMIMPIFYPIIVF